ncbi:unnamed protein product [Meloidogyne enterolobii]|uniref:Uncharacterized protein n=1 Tax=Meloidogyne enterolobii TaxID=390850 RepID=A0ACB0Z6F2_MELEN
MTNVWNKLTTQLSRLRSTNSLSTLNQKHLIKAATAATRSKSSENLNRINLGNKQLLISSINNCELNGDYRCPCCQQPTNLSSPSAAFSQALILNKANNSTTTTPKNSDIPSNGFCSGGKESGYSSASPRRKNLHKTATVGVVGNLTSVTTSSSASQQFFQKFRSREKNREKDGRDSFYCSSSAATSAGTSTSNNTTNNTNLIVNGSECNFSCCTQKKGWWRSSVHSHLTTTENEQTLNDQQQQQNIHFRRPSEPTISNEHNIQRNTQLNNYSDLTPNYLISPPKKKIGPKKTKSTFAILFPHNFHPHLPMSFSWNNNLSSASSPSHKSTKTKKTQQQQPPPDPAPEYFDEYKQTVRATDEFGEFIQPKQQNGDIINLINNKEITEQQRRKHSKRRKQSSSSGQNRIRDVLYASMCLDELNRTVQGRPGFDNSERSYSSAVPWDVPGFNCSLPNQLIVNYFNQNPYLITTLFSFRLVNALLWGRWRSNSKNKYCSNKINGKVIETVVINNEQYEKSGRKQKRSRSVGANQQMRISTTMCSGALPMDSSEIVGVKKNSCCSNGEEKHSLMFGNMSFFDDVHPAYWGFRTPQSETYYSCTGATEDEPKSPASSGTSSFGSNRNSLDVFRRLEMLGEGSYATVWKSENRIDGSIVALKEIRLQEQEGLPFTAIREISLLRALRHANIVRLHQIIIQQPKALVLVFEYMKTDLAKYLENYSPNGLDPLQTKVLLFQLLRGLAFCHERKILHRDLKPQNLLLSIEGELKLADFGLARAKSVPSRTYSHDVVTLWYRPPDVLLGSTVYSTSLDIWGVGCIFAEMCSGSALFPGANEVSDQLHKIFSVRGLPNLELWPEVVNLPKWSLFTFPNTYIELDLLTYQPAFYKLGDEGLKLITQLLQLKPTDRISAEGAMLHKYFDELPKTLHALLPNESVFSVIKNCPFKWNNNKIKNLNNYFDTKLVQNIDGFTNNYF